jgi:hypothetical protein
LEVCGRGIGIWRVSGGSDAVIERFSDIIEVSIR